MTAQETYILTHYTEIAESKQRNVRRMQAETARGILLGVVTAVVKGLLLARSRSRLEDWDQA